MKKLISATVFTLTFAAVTQAVPLMSFSAVGQSRQVFVRWVLTSDVPVVRFDVLRNGLVAYKIPVTLGDRRFEWVDNEVQNDREYSYSLIAVMNDGSRRDFGTVTATPAYDATVVQEYRLHQNFPNPFNPETTIEVDLAETGLAELTVFDVLGQIVATPLSGNYARGRYSVLFDGRDLPSGVYFYQLRAGGFVDQKKMVLLK